MSRLFVSLCEHGQIIARHALNHFFNRLRALAFWTWAAWKEYKQDAGIKALKVRHVPLAFFQGGETQSIRV